MTLDPSNPLASVVDLLAATANGLHTITNDLSAHRKPLQRVQAVARLRSMADDLAACAAALAEVAATGRVEVR